MLKNETLGVQHILGHSSSKTTEIYTHITQKGINNIINPLDQFDFLKKNCIFACMLLLNLEK